jgi:hypothetical protein
MIRQDPHTATSPVPPFHPLRRLAAGAAAALALAAACASGELDPHGPAGAPPQGGESAGAGMEITFSERSGAPPVQPAPVVAGELELERTSAALVAPDTALTAAEMEYARRTLAVTDEAIVGKLSLEKVMDQLAVQAGVPGVTGLSLFQELWDTQNLRSESPSAVKKADYCDLGVNLWPYECSRRAGKLTAQDPFPKAGLTRPEDFIAIGLTNRIDIHAPNWSDCGEYRMIFARRSGSDSNAKRALVIFEARLPNPQPTRGMSGCKPIARFWDSLAGMSVAARGDELVRFFFKGTAGSLPVIHIDNYGNRSTNTGQIRTNEFMDADQGGVDWVLREFKLRKVPLAGGGTRLMNREPVKTNPFGDLFSDVARDQLRAESFQKAFLAPENLRALATASINGFSFPAGNGAGQGNAGESFSSSFVREQVRSNGGFTRPPNQTDLNRTDDYEGMFTRHGGGFAMRLQAALNATFPNGAPITPLEAVRRAEAMSCAGCHERSDGKALGGGLTWPGRPNSFRFVHVSERRSEMRNGRFAISSALEFFLRARHQELKAVLAAP